MIKRLGLAVCGILLVISLTGCAALLAGAVGGVGTAFWLSGKLSNTFDKPRANVEDATKAALKSLDMEIRKEATAKDVTQIISTYKDGSEVWIDIRPITAKSTKIEVRVGARGNKTASQEILTAIEKRL